MAQRVFDIDARLGGAVGMLSAMSPAIAGAMRERMLDMVSHHRKHILKHHKLPSGRRGQQFLAARLRRYATDVNTIEGLKAESLGVEGRIDRRREALLWNLEHGGTISTAQPMAIPMGFGLAVKGGGFVRGGRKSGNFYKGIGPNAGAAGEFDITRKGFLVRDVQASRGEGARSQLFGRLVRSRRQPAMLGFDAAWRAIEPGHVAKFSKDIDTAMTVAGREKLADRTAKSQAASSAYIAAFKTALAAGSKSGDAAMIAREAAQRVRKDRLSGSS